MHQTIYGDRDGRVLSTLKNFLLKFSCFTVLLSCAVQQSESALLDAQSCLTLCDPMDCSPPGSSVHGIFLARILEWVAIYYARGSSRPRDRTHVSCVSCIVRQILYPWATWEALLVTYLPKCNLLIFLLYY